MLTTLACACIFHHCSTQYDASGITQLRLPTTDGFAPSEEHLTRGAEFVQRAVSDNPDAKIFIHCRYVALLCVWLCVAVVVRAWLFAHAWAVCVRRHGGGAQVRHGAVSCDGGGGYGSTWVGHQSSGAPHEGAAA